MKKTLLSLFFVTSSLVQLKAQCTPAAACSINPSTGYCTSPLENTALPTATASSSYSTVIQVKLGNTAYSGLITITNATVTSVTGLPAGIVYSTNPTNGVIPAGTDGCLLFSGTPTVGGAYTVTVAITANTSQGAIPLSAKWTLSVTATGTGTVSTGIKSEVLSSDNVILAPNPASSELYLSAGFHFGKVQITDALGKIVLTHDANYASQTTIDIHTLSKGVYFIQANDGNKFITRKFIKD